MKGFTNFRALDGLIPQNYLRLLTFVFACLLVVKIAAAVVILDYLFSVDSDISASIQDPSISSPQLSVRERRTTDGTFSTLLLLLTSSVVVMAILTWKVYKVITLSSILTGRISDGICIANKHWKVISANPPFAEIIGRKHNDLPGSPLSDLLPGFSVSLNGKENQKTEFELLLPLAKGKSLIAEISLIPLATQRGKVSQCLVSIRDITELRRSADNMQQLAYTDELTQLANRVHLLEKLSKVIAPEHSPTGKFALLYLDLDGFKDINDSLGHSAGDELLKIMSKRFCNEVRESDFVARLGGDEFCIIFKDFVSKAELEDFSGRLLNKIAEPVLIQGRRFKPQASIGIAIYPDDGRDPETLLKFADTAMYEAKHTGKHRVAFYNLDLTKQIDRRLSVEQDLRYALSDKQFELHYQPQVSLSTGAIVGVEALIRWRHPTRGLIFPDQFIDVAEKMGLIAELGDWVIYEACRQQKQWQRQGVDLSVAVNISGSHFRSPELVSSTRKALAENKLQAEKLELEITEGVMQVSEGTLENFHTLNKMGVKIAIDDFGTGYSSLNSLRSLPVDHLKIDRIFLQNVLQDEKQTVIISTIIGMAHALGLKVIVEGIESVDHVLLLQGLGCNIVQGYFFSQPVPADTIVDLYFQVFDTGELVHSEPRHSYGA